MLGVNIAEVLKKEARKADLNNNGKADWDELEPAIDLVGQCFEDGHKAINFEQLGKSFGKAAHGIEVLEAEIGVQLVDGLQFSDLAKVLESEEAQKAICELLIAFKSGVDSIDRTQTAVAFNDGAKAYGVVEKFFKDVKKK